MQYKIEWSYPSFDEKICKILRVELGVFMLDVHNFLNDQIQDATWEVPMGTLSTATSGLILRIM